MAVLTFMRLWNFLICPADGDRLAGTRGNVVDLTENRRDGSDVINYPGWSEWCSISFWSYPKPRLSRFAETDSPTMSTPWILHRLYTLDTSSPDFLRNIHSLTRHDEEEQYLTNLRGPELTRLVNFLDEVCTVSLAFQISSILETLHRPSMPSPQPRTLRKNVYTNCK